ncbi:SDR family oxidoreductase [Streptomyces sp. me109]|uniref:SDR family oxidoreductase n=1 Tax=Streptomyces sp. me109 TaxID=1827853 RepID=UPI0011CD4803|nr:SDR family oxidoreductase [Streptomyces sp. me109]TXS64431.1 SDR family oxidoreductase [Streptomyces sp. me109]
MTTSHDNELVFVSGTSTGMGSATARELADRGYHVLAGVRSQADADAARGPRIEPVFLDVTNPEHIDALVARIADDPQGRKLVTLINNAGIAVNAPVETLPLEQWRRQFEVNLFGHIAVTQALLPFLHESRGRIVNISSLGGKVAMPTYGAYAGAKFALEAVSDALRRELAQHGVRVVVVEPGGVQTEMTGHGIERARQFVADMTPTQRQRYGGLMQAIINQATEFTAQGVTAEKAALVIAKAATVPKPRARYTVGRDAALMTRLARLLTDRTLDRLAAANLRPHMPKAAASA